MCMDSSTDTGKLPTGCTTINLHIHRLEQHALENLQEFIKMWCWK